MPKRKMLFVVCVLMGLFTLLVGCKSVKNTVDATGSMKIVLTMFDQGKEGSLQTVSDKIEISEFVITVTKDSSTVTQHVPYSGTNAETTFTNLLVGEWNVDVIAKDAEGHSCYGGSAVSSVTEGSTTVEIPLYLLNGDLDTKVILPVIAGVNVTSGKVTLVNPVTGMHIEKDLAITGTEGLVSYGSVKAGTWYVEAELFENGNKLVWGSGVITVFPDQDNLAIIEFGDTFQGGDLQIIVIINESPSDPTGLSATVQDGKVLLEWNPNPEANIAGYTVYRANSETAFKKLLTYSLIPETNYMDTDIQMGEEYFYWVQAYDSNGFSSELSAACSLIVNDTPTEISIDLGSYSRVYYVNQSTGSDSGDGSINNPFKRINSASSRAATIDNSVVYITGAGTYEIPLGLASILSIDKQVSFIADPKIFGQVIFELTYTGHKTNIFMNAVNSFIGIVFTRTSGGSGSYFEDFSYGYTKLSFYNCVFIKGEFDPYHTPICSKTYTDYYNCEFLATLSTEDDSVDKYYANYTNCAFTQKTFTNDLYNLHSATIDNTYMITSTGWQNTGTGVNPDNTQANIGVYGGTYAWGIW